MEGINREPVVIQGFDVIDVLRLIEKKKNKFAAVSLQEVEELNLEPADYERVRKVFLDTLNEYTRSMMRALLGDIEIPPYKD